MTWSFFAWPDMHVLGAGGDPPLWVRRLRFFVCFLVAEKKGVSYNILATILVAHILLWKKWETELVEVGGRYLSIVAKAECIDAKIGPPSLGLFG